MNNSLLRQELIRHEGRRNTVYKDSLGLLTVGVGHLVLPKENLKEHDFVSDAQVNAWFEADISRSILLAKNHCPSFDTLDDCRQRVLVNLAFNMGNRLAGFKHMLAAVEAKDFNRAAAELQDSAWFTQVATRGIEVRDAMKNGYYSFE